MLIGEQRIYPAQAADGLREGGVVLDHVPVVVRCETHRDRIDVSRNRNCITPRGMHAVCANTLSSYSGAVEESNTSSSSYRGVSLNESKEKNARQRDSVRLLRRSIASRPPSIVAVNRFFHLLNKKQSLPQVEKDVAVAGVVRAVAAVAESGREGERGDEARDPAGGHFVGEEAQERKPPHVAFVVPMEEGTAGEEAGPVLADERAAEEARGVVGRHAEEDLLDVVVQERPRRHEGVETGAGMAEVGIEVVHGACFLDLSRLVIPHSPRANAAAAKLSERPTMPVLKVTFSFW